MTTRPRVAVAEAVGAVIAAQLQRDLVQLLGQPLPDSVAALLGRNAVAALRQDGWHIGPIPPTPEPTPADPVGSPE
ncbi:hypothetical protein [Streptomyces sp. TBY4]|uniref:hypothetical protein n=1 Tax=Streptomyces sp. TBY4 TaxID=2962030 RepID=UPI0020B89015|nr:hypothetical protein [Streptomyces sp. TBY4]MCP3758186.1 hypothetical protein [Streptomyces sp. TBY4]